MELNFKRTRLKSINGLVVILPQHPTELQP